MEQLKFCPKCGKETLIWNNISKLSCSNCDFVMYQNVAAAVAVLIKHKESYLFTRRNKEPKKDFLDLSGGFTDPEESGEETCQRELKEELNLDVNIKLLQYLGSLPNTYLYKNINYNTLDLFYLYEIDDVNEFTLETEEISDIVWLSKDEIKLDDLAFESQRQFLKNYFKI
ncbi:NUDIX hydrolase [Halpernia frigidisoli]|uniref:NUDIX domain-containing protein n=1 Tax=Halpernia frigidisoli TaxID=1125876 RepID=A0A1I3I579_9FLAO|nr:NUDIX domain-containing protein [Halpernia frigidisoli]SFI43125.1 NUDIX domain-containing protein [Halpernia frigidisoli]